MDTPDKQRQVSDDRDEKGRFVAGNRASKKGRGEGAVNLGLQACRKMALNLLPDVFEMAKKGNMKAIEIIMNRGLPAVKPIEISPEMPRAEKVGDLLELVFQGQLTPEKAAILRELMAKEKSEGTPSLISEVAKMLQTEIWAKEEDNDALQ